MSDARPHRGVPHAPRPAGSGPRPGRPRGRAAAGLGQQESVLDAGSRSQLLLDPALVHESRGVAFTPHPAHKHPKNPLLKADRPWEGWYATIFTGSVRYDPAAKRFQMWY